MDKIPLANGTGLGQIGFWMRWKMDTGLALDQRFVILLEPEKLWVEFIGWCNLIVGLILSPSVSRSISYNLTLKAASERKPIYNVA
jgi:hypothetical protein